MAVVRTHGLDQLRRALRAAGDKAGLKELKRANVTIARKVLDRARPGIAAVSSTVAASGEAVQSQVGAKVRFTDVKAGGVIFGAHHDKPRVGPSGRRFRGYNQFRTFKTAGYHVLPEAEQVDDEAADEVQAAVDRILDKYGVPRG